MRQHRSYGTEMNNRTLVRKWKFRMNFVVKTLFIVLLF